MTTKLKKNDELIQILRDAGIVTKEYANPSAAGNPTEFIISTIPGGRGILIKNSDMAKIEVAVDKQHRQAVLIVKEGKRKVVRSVTFNTNDYNSEEIDYRKILKGNIEGYLKNKFPITIPGAKLTVSDIKEEKIRRNENSFHWKYSGKITATVTRTRKNTFLLGMDETSHFISVLPKEVKSVKAAHSLLRPRGLPASTVRQGEFFFVPVKGKVKINPNRVRNNVPLESGSAHRAQYGIPSKIVKGNVYRRVEYRGTPKYVKGLIFDKRAYRHAPVDLGDTWHKVVRNKESMTAVPKGTRTARRYD